MPEAAVRDAPASPADRSAPDPDATTVPDAGADATTLPGAGADATTVTGEGSGAGSFEHLLAELLEATGPDAGTAREALLRAYPRHRAAAEEFFADHDRMRRAVGRGGATGIRAAATEDTVLGPGGPPGRAGGSLGAFGDYDLLGEIARGGMGAVYKARQRSLKRLVALKTILPGRLNGEDAVRRFRAEAEAVGRLEHPHIVPVFEFGEAGGRHFFSMGYVEGGSLADKLRDGPLAPRPAAELVAAVARAVQYAHDRGVIHRDLKPGNVLIERDGTPKVTDFGLARLTEAGGEAGGDRRADSELTNAGQVLGTPAYMPPEQALGKLEIGPAADVWALGALLYACLTARPPFQAADPLTTLRWVVENDPVPPRQLNPAVPRDLETAALKCLRKAPGERYASAGALAEDLRRFLAGEPVAARPVSRAERAVKWARRRPATAGLIAASAVAVVALTAVAVGARYARALAVAHAETEAALDVAGTYLYVNRVGMAGRYLEENDPGRARELLDAADPRRRGWEWDYLDGRLDTEAVKFEGGTNGILSLAASPDGRFLSWSGDSGGEGVGLWDARTGRRRILSPGGGGPLAGTVAFSPDGTLLAVGGQGLPIDPPQPVSLFRFADLRAALDAAGADAAGADEKPAAVAAVAPFRELPAAIGYFGGLRFSPDGTRLAVAPGDHAGDRARVRVFRILPDPAADAPLEAAVRDLPMGGPSVYDVAWSPDGRSLAAGGGHFFAAGTKADGRVRLWDVATWQLRGELAGDDGTTAALDFAPDGKTLASGGTDGVVRLWDVSGAPDQWASRTALRGHDGTINRLAYAADGRLASGADDRTVRIWDAGDAPGPRALLRGPSSEVRGLAWLPADGLARLPADGLARLPADGNDDGEFVGPRLAAGGNDDVVRVWDGEPAEAALGGFDDVVWAVAVSPDGRFVAGGSFDDTVRLWDRRTDAAPRVFAHSGDVNAVAFSPDGTRLASGAGDWSDETRLGEVQLRDVADGSLLRRLEGHPRVCWTVAFSPDGRTLATGGGELQNGPGSVILWDLKIGRRRWEIDTPTGAFSVAFNPAGDRLALYHAVGGNGKVAVVNAADGAALFASAVDRPLNAADVEFSPDGAALLLAANTRLEVLDAADGTVRGRIPPYDYDVWRAAMHPGGTRVATAMYAGDLKLWHVETGQELLTLKGHRGPAFDVAFSRDGRTLVSGGGDKTVRLWRAE